MASVRAARWAWVVSAASLAVAAAALWEGQERDRPPANGAPEIELGDLEWAHAEFRIPEGWPEPEAEEPEPPTNAMGIRYESVSRSLIEDLRRSVRSLQDRVLAAARMDEDEYHSWDTVAARFAQVERRIRDLEWSLSSESEPTYPPLVAAAQRITDAIEEPAHAEPLYIDHIPREEMLRDLHGQHGAECDRPDLDRRMIDELTPRR